MPHICVAVTNDLSFDQRVQRICCCLVKGGHKVTLIGRRRKHSLPLEKTPYKQVRLRCRADAGKWFYLEFNLRLFFYLLFKKMDAICANDLDTILPCLWASQLKGIPRLHDAHELFCEQIELIGRPRIQWIWKRIEQYAIPRFDHQYTENENYAEEYFRLYQKKFFVIRNVPLLENRSLPEQRSKLILYQGAVNEGRGIKQLLLALKEVDPGAVLHVYGEGNYYQQAQVLRNDLQLQTRVKFFGNVLPAVLKEVTPTACIGINLIEAISKSYYLSMANKFYDYIHAAVPQITMAFPGYQKINDEYEVALLLDNLQPANIARAINQLLHDQPLYQRLQQNCIRARKQYNWQAEEKQVLAIYDRLWPGAQNEPA